MDTSTSWEAWERLRSTSGVPVRGARRVMTLILGALCTCTEGGRSGPAARTTS
jgi:hypothetical protein